MALWSEGSIIDCGSDGVVRGYLHDGAELTATAPAGLPLTVVINPQSLDRYLDFLGQLRRGRAVFGWPLQVQRNGQPRALYFAGTPMPSGNLLIFASPSVAGLDCLCADLVHVNLARDAALAQREEDGAAARTVLPPRKPS